MIDLFVIHFEKIMLNAKQRENPVPSQLLNNNREDRMRHRSPSADGRSPIGSPRETTSLQPERATERTGIDTRSLKKFLSSQKMILAHILVISGLVLLFMSLNELLWHDNDGDGNPRDRDEWKGWAWLAGAAVALLPGLFYTYAGWRLFLNRQDADYYAELLDN